MEKSGIPDGKLPALPNLQIRDERSCQITSSKDSGSSVDIRGAEIAAADAATCRSSAKKIATVISKFDQPKKELITRIGWGGFLQMPQINKVSRKLTVWILSNIDTDKREIVIKDGVRIPLNGTEFARIIGIPSGNRKVNGIDSNDPDDKLDFIKHCIGSVGFDAEEMNSLKAAELVITKLYPDGFNETTAANFQVAFVCYVVGNYISGKQRVNHGCKDFWGALLNVDEIAEFNWGEYAVDEVIESAKRVKELIMLKKPIQNVTGCSLGLQVYYLDNLDLGILNRDKNILPRVAAFDCESLRFMTENDEATTSNCSSVDMPSYGCSKLKGKQQEDSDSNGGELATSRIKTSEGQKHTFIPIGTRQPQTNPPTQSILQSFMKGSVKTKLSYKQIEALSWLNARTKLHFEALKSLVLKKTAVANLASSSSCTLHDVGYLSCIPNQDTLR